MTAQSAENGSEHDACQVTIQEKAVTTWLFDTDADAHVVPNCAWEQLGEPMLQTTSVTPSGANGQDLGAMEEVQVKGQSSVHSSGCTRRETLSSEWYTNQHAGTHVHFESTRKFHYTTERQPKSDNDT